MIAFNEEQPTSDLEEVVSKVFSGSGLLSKFRDFEFRREQQAMAEATASSLESGRSLVVEAGTGVGKSLAYLIPSALHARERRRKAIISTHTINLQEQLVRKDLPIVRNLFDGAGSAVLL
ncbi:MAG: DEAD/DEAH box helicase, partial [Verrucomicrobiales bacterium]|nr:DEAD/DEAH box helicase [Verrucomicrobiales bacterium]